MKISCCFAGHSEIYNDCLKDILRKNIINLIENEAVTDFCIGNYGDFDNLAYTVVNELKNTLYNYITLELVVPYITNDIKQHPNKKYERIVIPKFKESMPTRFRILATNQYMVRNCDFIICYVKHSWGGAAQTLEYAENYGNIKIIKI